MIMTRLPFDWKNVIGYLIAVAIQVAMLLIVYGDIACIWTFVVSAFLFALTAARDLNLELTEINKNTKTKRTRWYVRAQLIELLQFYSRFKW